MEKQQSKEREATSKYGNDRQDRTRQYTFWPSCSHTMTVILTTTDGLHPTTNSPPPTTHLALNACEALRCPSLCEARDLKNDDRQVPWVSGLFSGKQLRATVCLELRKQKPLSDALDALRLLCGEHMLRTQWEGGHAGTLCRQASL